MALTGLQTLPPSDVVTGDGTSAPTGFAPVQIRHAYGFDQITFSNGAIQGDGTGQTIALIEAYDDPNIVSDLAAFDSYFNLPAPPSFVRVAENGSNSLPPVDPRGAGTNNWELETALDVEWTHALAPGANILLIEAATNSFSDLISASVNYARQQPGVAVISMSFGSNEFGGETGYDSTLTTPVGHAGITFVASTGDAGSPSEYPAFSPNVLGVGGTTLSLDASDNYSGESAWGGSGGGISQFEGQPAYQHGVVTQSSTMRTLPDVAFDANSSSGVAVYDSYNNGTSSPWVRIAGTSFGAPSWGAMVAIADQGRMVAGLSSLDGRSQTLPTIYALPSADLHDVTTGANNAFAAGPGYDLVTGRGTPLTNLVVPSLIGQATVSGQVFNDANGNGAIDSGEAGLSGWTVFEDLNGDGSYSPATTTTLSNSVATPFAAGSSASSNIVASGLTGDTIRVTVTVNISYYRDSDLVLSLIGPGGTTVTLANRAGSFSANFTNTTFDDYSLSLPVSGGSGPFAGTYSPTTPLWALYGGNPNGTWTLQVNNAPGTKGGTINSWSLKITSGDPAGTTNASGGFQIANPVGGTYQVAELLQAPYVETAPAGGFYGAAVGTGATVSGLNFGNQLQSFAVFLNSPSINYSNPQTWPAPAGNDLGPSAGGVAIASSNAQIIDTQSSTLSSMTISLANPSSSNGDVLLGNNVGNIVAGRYSMATGTLVLSGTDTLANYLAALKLVEYNNANFGPGRPAEMVTVVANDGISTSNPAIATITINQAPSVRLNVNSVNDVATWTGSGPVALANKAIISDAESANLTAMTITVSAPRAGDVLSATTPGNITALPYNPATGQLVLSGSDTVANYRTALASLTYDNTSGASVSGLETVSVVATDGVNTSNAAVASINVNNSTSVASFVAGTYLFYDHSAYNGNTIGVGTKDDRAIDPSKAPYLGGGTASFTSLSGFSGGINGIMVDLTPASGNNHGSMSAADFSFRASGVGVHMPSNDPSTWPTAPLPNGFSVRLGAGSAGSDRIELTWPDDAINDEWLQVTVAADSNTGLATPYTFYFGNLIGDTGVSNGTNTAAVTGIDEIDARIYVGATPAPISTRYDLNKDRSVDALDQLIARNNVSSLAFPSISSTSISTSAAVASSPDAAPAWVAPSATPSAAPAIDSPAAPTTSSDLGEMAAAVLSSELEGSLDDLASALPMTVRRRFAQS